MTTRKQGLQARARLAGTATELHHDTLGGEVERKSTYLGIRGSSNVKAYLDLGGLLEYGPRAFKDRLATHFPYFTVALSDRYNYLRLINLVGW